MQCITAWLFVLLAASSSLLFTSHLHIRANPDQEPSPNTEPSKKSKERSNQHDREVKCSSVDANNYCCYYLDRPEMVKCLPRFIIAGIQKSGTTVLSALLSSHPEVQFAPRKEVHFFDQPHKKTNFTSVEAYLKFFDFYDTTLAPNNEERPLGASSIINILTTPQPPPTLLLPQFAESTPFYLAAPFACQKMSYLIPKVKLIIIMRDPVTRAFSEYQMKMRRVATQNEFIKILSTNLLTIYRCLSADFVGGGSKGRDYHHHSSSSATADRKLYAHPVDSWSHLEHHCFPDELVSHPYWTNFRRVFLKTLFNISSSSSSTSDNDNDMNNKVGLKDNIEDLAIDKKHHLWRQLLDKCFVYRSAIHSKKSKRGKTTAISNTITNMAANAFDTKSKPTFLLSERKRNLKSFDILFNSDNNNEGVAPYLHLNLTSSSFAYSIIEKSDYYFTQSIASWDSYSSCLSKCIAASFDFESKCLQCSHLQYPDFHSRELRYLDLHEGEQSTRLAAENRIINKTTLSFSVNINHQKYPRITDSIVSSSSDILLDPKSCFGVEKVKALTDAFGEEIREFQKCADEFNHTSSVTELFKAFKKCIRVNSGIQDQYFYRSLYAVQIYNCQRYISRDQFLFISNEELRDSPLETVKKALSFLGVRNVDYFDSKKDLLFTSEAIQSSVNSHFPAFESKSGWKLDSGYNKMPRFLDAYLRGFFYPYNELLYKMIGRNFSNTWIPFNT